MLLWETAGRRRTCHCDSEHLIRIMMFSLQCLRGCGMKFACRPTPCQYYKHLEGGRNNSDPFIPSHLDSISVLCPSFFYSVISLPPPPHPLNNNNNMLLSIHHTIYRINYSLWKSDHHPLSVSITFQLPPGAGPSK